MTTGRRLSADDLAAAIREAMATAASGPPTPERKFNKGGEFIAFGLNTPRWRAIMRGFRARLLGLSVAQRLDVAERLFAEGEGWLGHSAIYVVALNVGELTPNHFDALDRLAERFTGWSHVDDFCISVLQPLLLSHPEQTLALLGRWNRSPNRWKRRASVVAFVRKVGESGRFTDEALRLCDRLIGDPEDLVQKGVGWALKDLMRGDSERVLAYVKELRRRGAPATITLYAIRDLRGTNRAEVLGVRPRAANRAQQAAPTPTRTRRR